MNETCNIKDFYQCCCICKNQWPVYCHPANKKGKGSIRQIFGYGCDALDAQDGNKGIIFYDGKHGLCEMFQPF